MLRSGSDNSPAIVWNRCHCSNGFPFGGEFLDVAVLGPFVSPTASVVRVTCNTLSVSAMSIKLIRTSFAPMVRQSITPASSAPEL